MTPKNKLFLIFALLLLGCASSKKSTQTIVYPGWVQNKPISTEYYIGVGWADKNIYPTQYQVKAKEKALADLANDISSQVSSSALLFKFDNQYGYTDELISHTKILSTEQLEGYQQIAFFEDDTKYWVYYNLNKTEFDSLKLKRKNDACNIALDYYKNAENFMAQKNHYLALQYYIKGLETVKLYLNEPLETLYNGNNIYLGNTLYSSIYNFFNEISIYPNLNKIDFKPGKHCLPVNVEFTFTDNEKKHIANLPVAFYIGKKPLRNNKTTTSQNGKVQYLYSELSLKTGIDKFNVVVDMDKIAIDLGTSPEIKKLIRSIKAPDSNIDINYKNPEFFIITNELNNNKPTNINIVQNKASQVFALNNFLVVNNKKQADYILQINTNTQPMRNDNKMYYTKLIADIKLFDKKENIVTSWTQTEQGVQLNYNEAGIDAYTKFSGYLEKNFFARIKEAIEN